MNGFTFGDAALSIGGLALFLLGVRQAADGLKGLAGGRLRIVLSVLTGRRIPAMAAGTAVTFLLQSSTASTVMLVGLCNVGLLTLYQAAGVALGNFIGSTLIVQLIAFDVSQFALLGVAAGLVVHAFSRRRVGRSVADILIGFGLIYFGIPLIKEGLEPVQQYPALREMLEKLGSNPGYFLLGVIVAGLFTVATQSSAATVAVAFGMARNGSISVLGAMTFIFGAHIATFATPMLASLGSPRRGKQVVLFDIGTRLAGVLIFAPLAVYIVWLAKQIAGEADAGRLVAWQHTLFNAANALLVMPFLPAAVRLVRRVIPITERPPEGVIKYVDPDMHDPPPIALEKARKEVHHMGKRIAENLKRAVRAVQENDAATLHNVAAADEATDTVYEVVTDYLGDVRGEDPRAAEERMGLLYMLKDLEYAGDIVSKDIVRLGLKKEASGRDFSIEGDQLLNDYLARIHDHFVRGLELVVGRDGDLAREIQREEADLNARRREAYEAHLVQLHRGVADAQETSSVYTDLLAALQQMARSAAELAETALGAEEPKKSRESTTSEE